MKLLVECSQKKDLYLDFVDGIILPLENFSVESVCYFSMDEIEEIVEKKTCDVFVKLNKNFMNEDIEALEDVLKKLDSLSIAGVFFYDLAVLELVRENHLKLPLIWNQTHMVNNYKTCNYYYEKGVSYALLGKEITLEEIHEILEKSSIAAMVEVISKPSVAFSKRSLVTNYYKDLGKKGSLALTVKEKVTGEDYQLMENQNGTSFFLNTVTNGTGVIHDLYDWKTPYIIMREYGVENFQELVKDTKEYIQDGCVNEEYVSKYKKLGDSTNFFFKKTIYRVKKNG
jgi:collagenase-like PrtC family protease